MKNVRYFLWAAAIFASFAEVNAQARLVLNGAQVVLNNGGRLVLENPAPDAISTQGGGIKCTSPSDELIWKTGTTAATYSVPFLCRSGQLLMVSFTKTSGTGNGSISLATYATPTWENSLYLPTGVLHANTLTDADNSANMADRFWEIKATDYTQNPELTNIVLAYATADVEAAGNTLNEAFLEPLQWSEASQNWRGYLGEAVLNIEANTVTIPRIASENSNKYWMLADNSASVLPVDFMQFSAVKSGTQTDLLWSTAREENNDYFVVERTRDGKSFEAIGTVKGAGTTAHQTTYTAADAQPFSGLSYYRIRQVDFDGKFSYSPLRSVFFGSTEEATVSAFPNPAKTHQLLEFANWKSQTLTVLLSDLQGRQLLSQQVTLGHETRKIIQVNFPALPSGAYVLRISGAEKVVTQQLLITN